MLGVQAPDLELSNSVNGAVMVFTRPNSVFLRLCALQLPIAYDPARWECIGPKLLTTLAKQALAQTETTVVVSTSADSSVHSIADELVYARQTTDQRLTLLSKAAFYRHGWGSVDEVVRMFTQSVSDDQFLQEMFAPSAPVIAVHVWHSVLVEMGKRAKPDRGSIGARVLRWFCRSPRSAVDLDHHASCRLQVSGPWSISSSTAHNKHELEQCQRWYSVLQEQILESRLARVGATSVARPSEYELTKFQPNSTGSSISDEINHRPVIDVQSDEDATDVTTAVKASSSLQSSLNVVFRLMGYARTELRSSRVHISATSSSDVNISPNQSSLLNAKRTAGLDIDEELWADACPPMLFDFHSLN